MTDQTDEQTSAVTAGEDSGTTVHQSTPEIEATTKKLEKMSTSFSIWPPTQRTRDAVIKRLIQTLTDKSVLSDRYGTIPADEATDVARRIEEESFNAAPSVPADDEDDGIEILQCYSREISKRVLFFVKARSAESATVKTEENDGAIAEAVTEGEENLSVES